MRSQAVVAGIHSMFWVLGFGQAGSRGFSPASGWFVGLLVWVLLLMVFDFGGLFDWRGDVGGGGADSGGRCLMVSDNAENFASDFDALNPANGVIPDDDFFVSSLCSRGARGGDKWGNDRFWNPVAGFIVKPRCGDGSRWFDGQVIIAIVFDKVIIDPDSPLAPGLDKVCRFAFAFKLFIDRFLVIVADKAIDESLFEGGGERVAGFAEVADWRLCHDGNWHCRAVGVMEEHFDEVCLGYGFHSAWPFCYERSMTGLL